MSLGKIPSFRLSYQEDNPDGALEPLHIEPLEERSRLHNWRIKPHRHQEVFHLFILTSGHVEATIDGQKYSVSAPQGMIIPALCVHEFEFESDTTGYVLSAFNYELSNILADTPTVAAFFQRPIILRGTENAETCAKIHTATKEFYDEFKQHKMGRLSYLRALLKLVLIQISREQTQFDEPSYSGASSEEAQFSALTALINAHFREHKTNAFYANKLNISVSQLSRITNNVVGQSPHKLISNKLLLESKRHLIYTTMSQEQIIEALGIKDPGYFSRFFKKHTGVTPSQFRKDPTSALF